MSERNRQTFIGKIAHESDHDALIVGTETDAQRYRLTFPQTWGNVLSAMEPNSEIEVRGVPDGDNIHVGAIGILYKYRVRLEPDATSMQIAAVLAHPGMAQKPYMFTCYAATFSMESAEEVAALPGVDEVIEMPVYGLTDPR